MNHSIHENHPHIHDGTCGHTRIKHGDHTDFLHDGHLHAAHNEHFDECILEESSENPKVCKQTTCSCGEGHGKCEHEQLPHGDHIDYLVDGRLHHFHDGHCDDHGAVNVM